MVYLEDLFLDMYVFISILFIIDCEIVNCILDEGYEGY